MASGTATPFESTTRPASVPPRFDSASRAPPVSSVAAFTSERT